MKILKYILITYVCWIATFFIFIVVISKLYDNQVSRNTNYMTVRQIEDHNFLNPNDHLDRKWLREHGPVASDISTIWKAEEQIGGQLKKMIDASGEPAYDSALKMQMRIFLQDSLGIDSNRAKSLIESGYVGKVTNRLINRPGTIAATYHSFFYGFNLYKLKFHFQPLSSTESNNLVESVNRNKVGMGDWGFFGSILVFIAFAFGFAASFCIMFLPVYFLLILVYILIPKNSLKKEKKLLLPDQSILSLESKIKTENNNEFHI